VPSDVKSSPKPPSVAAPPPKPPVEVIAAPVALVVPPSRPSSDTASPKPPSEAAPPAKPPVEVAAAPAAVVPAKPVSETVSAEPTAPAKPADHQNDSLPKVIIAPEAVAAAASAAVSAVSAASDKVEKESAPESAATIEELSLDDVVSATSAPASTEMLGEADTIAEPELKSEAVAAAEFSESQLARDVASLIAERPEPSPYAAVAEAARTSSHPPPPNVAEQSVERRPSRHPSWYTDAAHARGAETSAKPVPAAAAPVDENIKWQPITSIGAGKIEASPIMGIQEGLSTAASGKKGISVYPPAPAADAPVTAAESPGKTMRFGSVSPHDPSGRRSTQMLGTPFGMASTAAASVAPSIWTPPSTFGAHQVPGRESDPPPPNESIPPPPKNPSQVGQSTLNAASRPALSQAVQSHPLTPVRGSPAHATAPVLEMPSTAMALAHTESTRTRSEPPAASSIVCDVPKGWSPHPSLTESDNSEELAVLRDQLYRLAQRECFVVGVSSGPEMAAYKSGVAGRLAWMLAQPGHARVLFMEGDFDHPIVHRLMRIDMPIASGFSEQMRRRMNGSPPGPWTIVRCAPNLYVLAEGLVRSPGLLPTVHFADSVNELRRAYDLIVIDGPAGGMSVDTRAIDAVTDGIVLAGDASLLDRASTWFGKKQLTAVVSVGSAAPRSK
jgi:Mrp family chromosome partitioning ATPase